MAKKTKPKPENYPLEERGQFYYVKHPVKNKNGKWIGVNVIEGGYQDSPLYCEIDSEENCQKACDVHNRYHGFSEEYVKAIVNWSMFGKYIKPKL